MTEAAEAVASTSNTVEIILSDDEAPTFTLNEKNPRRRAAIAKGGKGAGKGKGKADENYQVPSDRLRQYLSESERVARRGISDWKKQTHQDKRLAKTLTGFSKTNYTNASRAAEHDDILLPLESQGSLLQPENELERTYRVTQAAIKSASGSAVAAKGFAITLPGGPFAFDYSRNGRFLAFAGHDAGHIAMMDWHSAKLMAETHVNETTRSVRWLHDSSFVAVAQRRYVYIYSGPQAVEIHQLRGHVEVTQMEFLPYHWLLATVGKPGWLKYHDTSTGRLVAEHRTKLGSCETMCQNPHNSIIHLGHQNGTVTMWSPGMSQPHVRLLAHHAPVTGVSIDPSSHGRIMATTGLDGEVNIWDCRNWKSMATWNLKRPPTCVNWSQKGLLAVGWGSHVNVYAGVGREGGSKGAYMSQLIPGESVTQVQFCPYEDVLGVGHSAGFTSLLIPGAGESHFDALEADPFETTKRRREREVKALLDKLPADMITMDPDMVGTLQKPQVKENPEKAKLRLPGGKKPTPFRKLPRQERLDLQGRRGEEEDIQEEYEGRVAGGDGAPGDKTSTASKPVKEKMRMRGRNSSLKRLLRKKRKNVITPETEAIRAKMAAKREWIASKRKDKDNS